MIFASTFEATEIRSRGSRVGASSDFLPTSAGASLAYGYAPASFGVTK